MLYYWTIEEMVRFRPETCCHILEFLQFDKHSYTQPALNTTVDTLIGMVDYPQQAKLPSLPRISFVGKFLPNWPFELISKANLGEELNSLTIIKPPSLSSCPHNSSKWSLWSSFSSNCYKLSRVDQSELRLPLESANQRLSRWHSGGHRRCGVSAAHEVA